MHIHPYITVTMSVWMTVSCSTSEFGGRQGKVRPAEDPDSFSFLSPTGRISNPAPEATWTDSGGKVVYSVRVTSDAACKETIQSHDRIEATAVNLNPLADGTWYLCGQVDGVKGGRNQANNNGFAFTIDSTPPVAEISGTPKGDSQAFTITATVGGLDVVAYKFKQTAAESDCAGADGWSEVRDPSQPVDINLGDMPDGPVVLCAVGKDDLDNWQSIEKSTIAAWKKATGPMQVTLTTDSLLSNKADGHHVAGTLTSKQLRGRYAFVITDADGEVVFEAGAEFKGAQKNTALKAPVEVKLPEGRLKVELIAYDEIDRELARDEGSWLLDMSPPQLKMYSGVKEAADTCTNPPQSRQTVASKLLPLAYCAHDPGVSPSGVTKTCMVFSEDETMPAADDACWKDVNDLSRQALLQKGPNHFVGWALDAAGNIGKTTMTTTLNLGEPPYIDILAPSSSAIAAAAWAAGETKIIKWKVTDNDTPFEEIKVIVSLVEAKDHTAFTHLACNFANSELWNQCPAAGIENSLLLKKFVNDQTMEFTFNVPPEWDQSKQYLIVVTAIDQSGNASVASTQEINTSHEVLAGRTYKGIGGSGVTLQRARKGVQWLAVDEWGTLYDISNNIKIDIFDYRTCRMSRKTTQAPEPFDCPDILVTDYDVTQAKWHFDRPSGSFYTYSLTDGERYILRIDPKNRAVLALMGGAGKTDLISDLSAGDDASAYRAPALSLNMFFDTISRRLLFKSNGQIFSLDSQGKLRWQIGAPGGTNWPTDATAKARDILLPAGNDAFALSKNGTLLIGGAKLTTTPNGGGQARQYVYTGVKLDDLETTVSGILITKNELSPYTEGDSGYLKDIEYDPAADVFYASIAWWGYYRMTVPATPEGATSYPWQIMVQYSPTTEHLEGNVLAADQTDATLPRKIYAYSYGMALAGGNLMYFSNDYTGTILSLDMTNWRIDPVIGFILGHEPDQSGINRRLDMPLHMAFDGNGDLVFNDFYNLQKLKLSAGSTTNPEITTLADRSKFGFTPFVFDGNKIYQVTTNGLATYDYANLAQGARSLTIATGSQTSGYQLQFGLGNSLTRVRSAHLTSVWNSTTAHVWKALMVSADMGLTSAWPAANGAVGNETLLTATDLYSLNMPYCGTGAENCTHGAPVGTAPKYYNGASYRIAGNSGMYEWHSPVGVMAFDTADTEIYTCLNQKFAIYELATGRVYEYTVTAGTKNLTCYYTAIFRNFGGDIYFAYTDGIYKLDVSQVKSTDALTANKATATLVPVSGNYVKGEYGNILVTSDWVYYTDKVSHRVIRNKRIP